MAEEAAPNPTYDTVLGQLVAIINHHSEIIGALNANVAAMSGRLAALEGASAVTPAQSNPKVTKPHPHLTLLPPPVEDNEAGTGTYVYDAGAFPLKSEPI